ncbi:MAG: RDD family protein [Candidatus Aminicenantes bacterium]|nr:RDD family protein [Candidatus Aminicenantes bacterium]
MIQKHKAHPDQAGFFRRFLGFLIDNIIILFISIIVFLSFSEIMATCRGEKGEFSKVLGALKSGQTIIIRIPKAHSAENEENSVKQDKKTYFVGGKRFNLVFEFFIGYVYYIIFFRFSGRTPGKRLLGLRVIDLKGRSRLGWYQSLERAHGYAASTLLAFIGFLQVLWDHDGLAMHDKLAGTTVIRIKK